MEMLKVRGRYRFKKLRPIEDEALDAITPLEDREVISVGPWIHNLVVAGDYRGLGLIAARMGGDTTHDIQITTASIGTGTTPPTDADTDLETEVLDDIPRASQEHDERSVMVGFFIPTADLPNGTYNEFAVWCGTRLFARSLMIPAFTKSTNEDVGIEYLFELDNELVGS